ncbi:hypothetical protein RHGRI_035187 [Rhododendron griersonianum]|uniref:Uncharacterized protein n=1 Tax=Rhododendron griersonianum TaxID=479676 RepID=A0AAV6I3Z5_9ERIC|nr:hypothetical protein RHGRI_035187 [Rhododendron griersonianum]
MDHLNNLELWNIDPRVQRTMEAAHTGFEYLVKLTFPVNHDIPLVSVLIDSYREQDDVAKSSVEILPYVRAYVLYLIGSIVIPDKTEVKVSGIFLPLLEDIKEIGKYKNHNLVVHGWKNMIYEEKSWVAINSGVFLIRNCQWSLEFMEVWSSMGPQSPNYDKWSKIQKAMLPDKLFPESGDQSALVYLLLKEKEKWGDKIYVAGEYYFEGYWLEIVETLDNITEKYVGIEKEVPR